MRVIIVEDDLSDLKYYLALSSLNHSISLLFLAVSPDYTAEKARENIDLFYGNDFCWINNYIVCTTENIKDFLENNIFDFYIFDSLDKKALQIIKEINLPKEKIVFFSGTTPFRELVGREGYRAYQKKDINNVIADYLKQN